VADDNVLQAFLVSIGFKIDEQSLKRFREGLKLITKEVGKLGLEIGAVSTALVAGVDRITSQFTNLFYTSQLTGSTIKNLEDLRFAAGQVGVGADAMNSALRGTHLLLQQPGGEALIRAFTGFKGPIKDSQQGAGHSAETLVRSVRARRSMAGAVSGADARV
jgi:hypothetical protein